MRGSCRYTTSNQSNWGELALHGRGCNMLGKLHRHLGYAKAERAMGCKNKGEATECVTEQSNMKRHGDEEKSLVTCALGTSQSTIADCNAS